MQLIPSTPQLKQTTNYNAPHRPQTIGDYEPVHLNCNIFNMKFDEFSKINQIPITFEPEIEDNSPEKIAEVIKRNNRELRAALGFYADSGKSLFAIKKPAKKTLIFEGHNEHTLILEGKMTKQLDMKSIWKKNSTVSNEIVRVLNIIINNKMRNLGFKPFGGQMKYFDLNKNLAARDRLPFNIYSGFKTTIGCFEGSIPKIIIDYCTKIVRSQNLWDEILEKTYNYGDTDAAFYRAFEELAMEKFFIADYGRKNVYKISGIEDHLTPDSEFPKNTEGIKTYYDYYLKTYKYKIRDRKQNLVFSIKYKKVRVNGKIEKREEKIHLVPEMLFGTGMTDEQRSDFRLMQDISKHTKLFPQQKIDYIYEHGAKLNEEKDKDLQMDVDLYSNEVQGKQLKFPQIEINGAKPQGVPLSYKWGGNFQVKGKLYKAKDLTNWAVIYQDFEIDRRSRATFKDVMIQNFNYICKGLGFKIEKPKKELNFNKNSSFSEIEKLIKIASKNKCQILVFMLPDYVLNKGKKLYGKIKALAAKEGVATQVMKCDTKAIYKRGQLDNRKVSGYAENLLIQIERKIGATPWKVNNFPYQQSLVEGRKDAKRARPIVIGIDVCHKKGRKSSVGISGTITTDFTQTRTDMKIQPSNRPQEIIDYIGEQTSEIVRAYIKRTKETPTNVIIYRDGVGEGQIKDLYIREVNHIKTTLEKEFPEMNIQLSVILVTKRISERFFTNNRGEVQNPNTGLIVDTQVTREGFFEWFMVAQNVTQGCATPTKFRVIHNDAENTVADYWYNLTYFLTFMFMNWKGPIRVPMVLQNAHTMAFKVSDCGMTDIAESLKDREFFL